MKKHCLNPFEFRVSVFRVWIYNIGPAAVDKLRAARILKGD